MGKADSLHNQPPTPVARHELPKEEDRRIRGERLEVCFPVIATHKGKPIQGFIEAINISWSGMLLATNFPLNVGDLLVLEFTLPGREISLTTKAKVVHKIPEEIPEEATLIGIAFQDLDPNTQKIIAGFVLEHLSVE